MKKITSEWLIAASDDLLLITEIISKAALTHIAAFHAQQAIEKSLKAIVEERNIEIPKIHKLKTLFNISGVGLDGNDSVLVSLLDSLYIEARYPGEMGLLPEGKPSIDESVEFYNFAKRIFDKVKMILES